MLKQIPILEKRRIQAEVVGPLFKEMVEQVGHQKASAILKKAIRKAAIKEGQFFRKNSDPKESIMDNFIALYDFLLKKKPVKSKGIYIRSIALCSTQSSSLLIEPINLKWKGN